MSKPLFRRSLLTGVPMLTTHGQEVITDYMTRKLLGIKPTKEPK